jgi:haloacetate dehalogenase
MALDHPQVVTRLALLDIVPTRTVYTQVSKNLATWYFHWFFLIQPEPLPEMLLGGQAEPFLRNFAFRGLIPHAIEEPVFADLRCFTVANAARCARTTRAASICGMTSDLGTQLACPTLVLWVCTARCTPVRRAGNRRPRAPQRRAALPAGHWLPEECPGPDAALVEFLA